MKPFLHKVFLFSLFSFFFSLLSFSQYNIPWATKQPAWVFPIWFEDGNGQKDTLYLSYDPTATSVSIIPPDTFDSMFGERLVRLDTSKFNIYFFGFSPSNDSVLKSFTTGQATDFILTFEAYKGFLPLKIYWDVNLFRSDSLPFPNQSPAPSAQGRIDYDPGTLYPNGGNCFINEPVLLTDTGNYYCIRKDSMIFYYLLDTNQENVPIPYFSFSIEPWTGYYTGISDSEDKLKISLSPNPTDCNTTITVPDIILFENQNLFFSLYDVLGNEVNFLKIQKSNSILERNKLANGIYFYRLYNDKKIFDNGKLIIQ